MLVTHLTLDLGPWHKGCHRIDDEHIYGTAPDQDFRNIQGLLTRVWL